MYLFVYHSPIRKKKHERFHFAGSPKTAFTMDFTRNIHLSTPRPLSFPTRTRESIFPLSSSRGEINIRSPPIREHANRLASLLSVSSHAVWKWENDGWVN